MTTPPQTPRSTTSSVSGVAVGVKREAFDSEMEPEKKKRRIAPTLVGGGDALIGSDGAPAGGN